MSYLCPAKREDALLREHVEGQGVDALLVDDHERLSLLTHFSLEFDHLHHLRAYCAGGVQNYESLDQTRVGRQPEEMYVCICVRRN